MTARPGRDALYLRDGPRRPRLDTAGQDPPLSPVSRLRVLHSKMAPKIQTRTEIRYKRAQCFLGTNLFEKKNGAIISAIFGALLSMRALPEGGGGRGSETQTTLDVFTK